MAYSIRQSRFESIEEFDQLIELQNKVYEDRGLVFKKESFYHWYIDNPVGKVLSFNAFDKDKMVAHYACIPTKMNIEGRIVRGIKSMATVTHPDYRGKGLFKQLAKLTYDYAKEQGFEFVIGVANANSFPGFMKYFPFTFVSQLKVKMGFGCNIKPDGEKTFSTYWDAETLNWRMTCCKADYSRKGNSLLGQYNSMVQTFMGTFPDNVLSLSNSKDKEWGIRPKLYVGLGAKIKSPYLTVPRFIKRSPFNLIFMDLTGGNLPVMTKDNVFFQLFDFDVA